MPVELTPTPGQPAPASPMPPGESQATATEVPQPTPSPSITPTPEPCDVSVCYEVGHFLLTRPIVPPGRDTVDASYRYGSTQQGLRETHHGIEMLNSQGTPVVAAADGTVIVAGNDDGAIFADWPYFYGNLVVIEHHFPEFTEPVYTLYAHLFEVQTTVGSPVKAGQPIGLVGLTGTAEGSHLHFEVRVGENSYAQTRNPELWLAPHLDENGQPHGAIAGRVLDEYGDPIEIPNLVIERLTADGLYVLEIFYLSTYADHSVNGDDLWQETFALGDLPAGLYRVSFVARGMQVFEVEVRPGMLTLITFDAAKQ